MKSILKEPLIHFFLLGGLIFGVVTAFGDEQVTSADRLELSAGDQARLTRQFQAVWNRMPSEAERADMISRYIDQEVLVREAVALGLDQGDPVIRQRLEQKMRFLIEGEAASAEPDDTELQNYLVRNSGDYRTPPKLSFEQVMLPADATAPEIAAVLAALLDKEVPEMITHSALLPAAVTDAPPSAVDATFGTGFFSAIAELETAAWSGPVQSGYGSHLVRITRRTGGGIPELSEIRNSVLTDWMRADAQKRLAERIKQLRSTYSINVLGEKVAER